VRRRKLEGAKRAETNSSKVEQHRDIMTTNTTASSLVKETRDSLAVDTNRACSDRRSKKNKCRDGMPESASRICTLEPMLKAIDFTYFYFLLFSFSTIFYFGT